MALEDCVAQACDEKGLWKDEYFQRKCVELSELLAIRHCVFVMGPPAAGKSETWRTLAKAQTIGGQKTKVQDINPKSITPARIIWIHNFSNKRVEGRVIIQSNEGHGQ